MRNTPQGTALAPQGQITSGQGSANARLAGRWQGLPGWHLPMVWPAGGKGWAQGADTKAMHRLTPREPAAGLVPQPGCYRWSLQPASKISLHKHLPLQAQPVHGRPSTGAPGSRLAGANEGGRPPSGIQGHAGGQEEPRAGSPRRRQRKAPWATCCHVTPLLDLLI